MAHIEAEVYGQPRRGWLDTKSQKIEQPFYRMLKSGLEEKEKGTKESSKPKAENLRPMGTKVSTIAHMFQSLSQQKIESSGLRSPVNKESPTGERVQSPDMYKPERSSSLPAFPSSNCSLSRRGSHLARFNNAKAMFEKLEKNKGVDNKSTTEVRTRASTIANPDSSKVASKANLSDSNINKISQSLGNLDNKSVLKQNTSKGDTFSKVTSETLKAVPHLTKNFVKSDSDLVSLDNKSSYQKSEIINQKSQENTMNVTQLLSNNDYDKLSTSKQSIIKNDNSYRKISAETTKVLSQTTRQYHKTDCVPVISINKEDLMKHDVTCTELGENKMDSHSECSDDSKKELEEKNEKNNSLLNAKIFRSSDAHGSETVQKLLVDRFESNSVQHHNQFENLSVSNKDYTTEQFTKNKSEDNSKGSFDKNQIINDNSILSDKDCQHHLIKSKTEDNSNNTMEEKQIINDYSSNKDSKVLNLTKNKVEDNLRNVDKIQTSCNHSFLSKLHSSKELVEENANDSPSLPECSHSTMLITPEVDLVYDSFQSALENAKDCFKSSPNRGKSNVFNYDSTFESAKVTTCESFQSALENSKDDFESVKKTVVTNIRKDDTFICVESSSAKSDSVPSMTTTKASIVSSKDAAEQRGSLISNFDSPLKRSSSNAKQETSDSLYNSIFKELHNNLQQKYEYELPEKETFFVNNVSKDTFNDEMTENNSYAVIEDLKEGLKETFVDDTSSDCQYSDEFGSQEGFPISKDFKHNNSYTVNEHFPFVPATNFTDSRYRVSSNTEVALQDSAGESLAEDQSVLLSDEEAREVVLLLSRADEMQKESPDAISNDKVYLAQHLLPLRSSIQTIVHDGTEYHFLEDGHYYFEYPGLSPTESEEMV
ncbi:hypothetical protein TNCT_4651 [Trichonephila clavata]|uniref:Uncharacterized protein n=1 Tax=Trichonephila clavata TaxID=2740835 RepID=A0A8X6H6M2_TRICU|nr:hypothetical protein TNCT_4651 [Trichonephila clavata]